MGKKGKNRRFKNSKKGPQVIHVRSPSVPERSTNTPERSPSTPEWSPSAPEWSPSAPECSQSIPDLFKEKCVLVIGATEFLGKVLVEKLLRSCPGIHEVFILLNPSNPCDMNQMLNDFLEQSVFDGLRMDGSFPLQKIKPLTGDTTQDNLGLNECQFKRVISDISFVFHCDSKPPSDVTHLSIMNKNLIGVKNILDVCKSCKRLEALVHVSTAFSFCNYLEISERTYPELINPQQIIEALRWTTNDQFRALCMNGIKDRRNLYHFASALAEILITQSESLPVIIVRTSLVTASVKEPFPGWVDNLKEANGFFTLCCTGIVRTLLVKDNVHADCVPVDIVANTLIVAAHYMAVGSKSKTSTVKLNAPSRVPIINCTCPGNNLITWRKMMEISLPFLIQYPSIQVYGKPGVSVTVNPFPYNLYCLMFHYIPAILIDCVTSLTVKEPGKVFHYKRVHKDLNDFHFFTTLPFFYYSSNMRLLMQQMSPEDKELFPIDQSTLDWTAYMENYILGVRRYIFKETDETLPEARMKMMRIHYLWLAYKLFSMFGIFLWIAPKRRCRFLPTLLLQIFSYVRSAIAYFQRKFVFPLRK